MVAYEYHLLCVKRVAVMARLDSLSQSGVSTAAKIQWFQDNIETCSTWALDDAMDREMMREALAGYSGVVVRCY